LLRVLFGRWPKTHGSAATPAILPGPFQSIAHMATAPRTASVGEQPPLDQMPAAAPSHGIARQAFGRLSLKVRICLLLPLMAGLGAASFLAVMMVYYTVIFPHPQTMRISERAPVVRILARDGSVLAERGTSHDYMPLDLLPRHVRAAVVATEDRRFYEHYGLDPVGMLRAFFANLRVGRFVQGGSTLTQQLAKNLFLTSERTLDRKIEEIALALWLELRLSKDEILELYLNRVYFGAGAYGIEAASQRYFDKSARELSIAEGAVIAGLLKAPSRYAPTASPAAAIARSRIVLTRMVETGMIAPDDGRRAYAERVEFHQQKASAEASTVGYAVDFILEHLPPLVGSGHAEVIVETTIDAGLQKRAGDIVSESLSRRGAALGASQAAVIVLDNDGGILALVGGRDYAASQFNRAVKARRQPGSAFKPFVYLAALESGMTPDSITHDLPLTIGNWSPRNDSGEYAGEITMRHALARSINTVAVRLNQDVGRGRTIEVARRLGIKSDLREDPSLALGTSEVTLLELTGAYTTFANGGMGVEPHAIKRVRMSSGRVLFARKNPRNEQVIEPGLAGAMNDMLNAALVSGTGRRAALAEHPAAGKTGTTQDFRDAWFVGYTAHMAAGVWIGNDDSKPMTRAVGGGLPAEIWRQLMQTAHKGKAPIALPATTYRPAPGDDAVAELNTAKRERQSGSHPPRVDQEGDDLPWQRRKQTTSWQAAAPEIVAANEGTASAAYPAERIDDDFIARVLSDTSSASHASAHDEAAKPTQRQRGLMSLGGWW
jgi:penicillin-binding protein 1A